MRKFLQACLFVAFVTFSISLPAAMKRFTHSFHVSRLSLELFPVEALAKIRFGAKFALALPIRILRKTPIPQSDMSFCEEHKSALQSSNFAREAIFASASEWPKERSQISMQEVRQILSQSFDYLGRGSQAFVFASKDGSYVLKLFIFDFGDSFAHRFFHSLLGVSSGGSYSQQAKKRAIQTLEACRLAEQFLPEDTAIVYTHLNPGSENLPTVCLRGPAWKQMNIHPDSFLFVLQKRAKLLNESLMQTYLLGDRQRFIGIIDQLNALLNRRTACCIVNADPTLFENFGVIGERPVEIDFGNFIYCPELIVQKRFQEEKDRYTDQLLKWVERYIPQWKDDVAMRIKENK